MAESDDNQPRGFELRTLPRAKRLNRNALVVGGVLGGAVLVAAAVTLVENRTAIERPAETQAAAAAEADRFWMRETDGVPSVSSPPPSPLEDPSLDPTPNAVPGGAQVVPIAAGGGLDETARKRQERLARARDAAPLVPGIGTAPGAAPAPSGPLLATAVPAAIPASLHPDLLGSITSSLNAKDPTLVQNNQEAKRSFLDDAGVPEKSETNEFMVREPISPYEVTAGMIVPAVLVTQGDSDLPGVMTARVRENVYDQTTGRNLLIPQSTLIVGVYDSVVTHGQSRLLVAWQRLIYPDGTKLNIGGMPGTDLIGAAGFQDQVDRHYKRVFGSALLLSVITAGTTLSQDDSTGGGFGSERSTRDQISDTLANALGQNLGDLANEMIRREMNVQPTIKIRPGYRFNVFVNKDLVFRGPYLNTFTGGGLVP